MRIESEELIRGYYDNIHGSKQLALLFRRYLDTSRQQSSDKVDLIKITNLDRKIKLNQMENTWDFTRESAMFIRLCETFFYILISQT